MLSIVPKFMKLRLLTTCRVHFSQSCTKLKHKSIFHLIENIPYESKVSEAELFAAELGRDPKMATSIEVIGSGADGAPVGVAVKTPQGNYLVNCGEGIQKLMSEYKVKLTKSPNIFITFPSWRNLSGLLGVLLTLQESGYRQVSIHGHSCIMLLIGLPLWKSLLLTVALYFKDLCNCNAFFQKFVFNYASKFSSLKSLYASVLNCTHNQQYQDQNNSVKYILLHPSSSKTFDKNLSDLGNPLAIVKEEKNSASRCDAKLNKDKSCSNSSEIENKESANNNENSKERRLSGKLPVKLKRPAYCYVFSTKSTPGELNLEKCLDHGVPPGPLLGDLKRGLDITLEDGTIVKSEDVKGPDLPGVNIIAVECPSEEYLDSLLTEPLFAEYQSGSNAADAVIHFTSPEIVKNLKYQNWIKLFPQETKHLFINEENKVTGSVAIHRHQFKLNLLDPILFPLLQDTGIPDFPRENNSVLDEGHVLVDKKDIPLERNKYRDIQVYSDSTYYKCESNNFIKGETLCTIYLKPKDVYDYSKCLVLKKDTFIEEVFQDDVKEKIENCRRELQELSSKIESDSRIYPKILFLGTGSGKPSKIRNASGILIFFSENKSFLFDCGENTYNQLMLFYGKQRTREILRSLKAVFISHLHIDHHFGLVTVLKNRKAAFDNMTASEKSGAVEFEPALIFAPTQLFRWLQMFDEELGKISDLYESVGNSHLSLHSEHLEEFIKVKIKNLELKELTATPVYHCANSFGVSMTHKSGWKITYSGDTRPCEDLINLGMNSDILIHEATFDDTYKAHAKQKLHSTTKEAIEVGNSMKAKYILLTHFSQRYCYLPNIEEEFSHLNIGMVFDFMEVPFNRLPILPSLLIPLQYVFSKYDERVKLAAEMVRIKRARQRSTQGPEDEQPAKLFKRNPDNHQFKTSL